MKRRQKAKSRKSHKTKQNNTRRADKRGPAATESTNEWGFPFRGDLLWKIIWNTVRVAGRPPAENQILSWWDGRELENILDILKVKTQ